MSTTHSSGAVVTLFLRVCSLDKLGKVWGTKFKKTIDVFLRKLEGEERKGRKGRKVNSCPHSCMAATTVRQK